MEFLEKIKLYSDKNQRDNVSIDTYLVNNIINIDYYYNEEKKVALKSIDESNETFKVIYSCADYPNSPKNHSLRVSQIELFILFDYWFSLR